MADEYSTSFEDGGALVFNREAIEDLFCVARDFLQEDPKTAIEFEGGHKIESASLDSVLDDSYIRSLQIKSVRIRDRVLHRANMAWSSIDIAIDTDRMTPVKVSIDGDRDASVAARSKLENLIRGCSTWYAKLYRPVGGTYDAARFATAVIACIIVTTVIAMYFQGVPRTEGSLVGLLLYSAGWSIWTYMALSFVRKRMFPKLLFDLGKSAERVRAAATWRQVVFTGFILAIVASIIATIVTDRWKVG